MELQDIRIEDGQSLLDLSVVQVRLIEDLEPSKGLCNSSVCRDDLFECIDEIGRDLRAG